MRVVEAGQYFVTKDMVILDNFAQWLAVSISSVSTEQWQLYAKNLRAIKIEREENL